MHSRVKSSGHKNRFRDFDPELEPPVTYTPLFPGRVRQLPCYHRLLPHHEDRGASTKPERRRAHKDRLDQHPLKDCSRNLSNRCRPRPLRRTDAVLYRLWGCRPKHAPSSNVKRTRSELSHLRDTTAPTVPHCRSLCCPALPRTLVRPLGRTGRCRARSPAVVALKRERPGWR
jgi:hypothetical protein